MVPFHSPLYFTSVCFVLFFPSFQAVALFSGAYMTFSKSWRDLMMFSSCTNKTEIKKLATENNCHSNVGWCTILTTSGQWRPVKTPCEVDVKRFDDHSMNKKTRKFSIWTVTPHKNTSWQERMNSSRVTTPSLFLSIFWREKCKHISVAITKCIVFCLNSPKKMISIVNNS